MKMSEKTLLKKIKQGFAENYCNGSYKLELQRDYDEASYYVLYYTYETGETIALDIVVTFLGEVKFYSHVHNYYISNFNNHIKSVINVLRMLFDMIDSNKADMVKYYKLETEETEEPEETSETEKQYDTFDGCKTIAKIENINHCPNQNTCCIVSPLAHCNYNYKSDSCIKAHKNFFHDCEQVQKQMKAKHNPEWHHVSLATLANIDIDMLDEKRQLYLQLYRELKELIADLHKCKSGHAYERRLCKMYSRNAEVIEENKVSHDYINFFTRKISMCNVECGVWSSAVEEATGQHESRKYNRATLRY